MNVLPAPETRLHGRFLWPARIGWLAVCLLVLGMLAVNAPHLYWDTYRAWPVRQAFSAALTFFPTISAFVQYVVVLKVVAVCVFVGTGVVLAWRKSDDGYVLLVSATLLLLTVLFGLSLNVDVTRYPRWLVRNFPAIRIVVPSSIVVSLVLLFYLFPDGRFTPRWTAWLVLPATAMTLLFFHGAFALRPSPFWRLLPGEWGWYGFVYTLFGTALLGLALQLLRFKRETSPERRQQTKWVLFGLGLILLGPLLEWLFFDLLGLASDSFKHFVNLQLILVLPLFLPLTIVVSILRYRLWDVDLLVNRTLVFGGLTLLVAAVYALLVGLLSELFRTGNNVLLSILATGLIAVLFDPVRRRLQQEVNHLMYGERDDPVALLTWLGERLENTTVPEAILPALVETIAQTLKLPYVAVTVVKKAEGRRQKAEGGRAGHFSAFSASSEPVERVKDEAVAACGRPTDKVTSLSLVYQGRIVGQLLVASRAPGETFSRAEQRLLAQIAHQAAGVVHTVRLNQDLQRARERLVAAREEERRQMRRALHDGLGAQLASLTLKADAACRQLSDGPETARLLHELKADTQRAMHDIRTLVRSLNAADEEVSP